MTTFDTPAPISVDVEIGVGDIRIEASDRSDTTVEVRPSDPAKRPDVTAAEQTRVELAGEHLLVKAPSGWRQWLPRGGTESIDVTIALPAGSTARVEAGVATLRVLGRVGACHCKVGAGDIQVDEAGAVNLTTGFGDVTVERAAGRAEMRTGSGAVRIGSIDGPATVKNSNGDTWIGEITGEARVNAANGKISVDRAVDGVVAKTANGDVRVGEVVRGATVVRTAAGEIEVGVRGGVAAWLDLSTKFGRVHSDLESAPSPAAGEDTVEVHATTSYGDIAIHRSPVTREGSEA